MSDNSVTPSAATWAPYGIINIANCLTAETIATFDFTNEDLVTAIGGYQTELTAEKVGEVLLCSKLEQEAHRSYFFN